MNLFVVDKIPQVCARYLDDKRLVKAVLETAQLLSTAINEHTPNSGPYKSTHVNHPVTKWVSFSYVNYMWTFFYFECLCEEYTRRFNKVHKCEQHIKSFADAKIYFKNYDPSGFCNCTSYKQEPDVFKAYKTYLADKWFNDKTPAKARI